MTLVNPEVWGRTWTPFAQRYLIRDSIYPSKIIGHNNVPELQAMLMADADIIRREDVFGPDTWQIVEREVELPEEARRAYDTIVKEWLLYHEQGGEIVADHTLKRLIRLQQLTSGYLRNEEGQDFQIHSAKIDAVLADLDEIVESEEKAVVFHRFTWEGEHLEQAIRQRFPRLHVSRMAGGTSSSERTAGEVAIRDLLGPAVMVAQTRTAALGISFAEATHALFVSQSFSFTDEEQARDRIYKPGFNRCATYYRCKNTVDEFVARVISGKSSIHDAITHADVREMAYGYLGRR
jgi:SNF2 family DNA or RNA helicase